MRRSKASTGHRAPGSSRLLLPFNISFGLWCYIASVSRRDFYISWGGGMWGYGMGLIFMLKFSLPLVCTCTGCGRQEMVSQCAHPLLLWPDVWWTQCTIKSSGMWNTGVTIKYSLSHRVQIQRRVLTKMRELSDLIHTLKYCFKTKGWAAGNLLTASFIVDVVYSYCGIAKVLVENSYGRLETVDVNISHSPSTELLPSCVLEVCLLTPVTP